VRADTADDRVVTAVLVTRALDLKDAYRASLKIYTLPPHAERFALPKPERECDRPAGAIANSCGCVKQGARLSLTERLDLRVLVPRGINKRCDIALDKFASQRRLQGARDDLVE
jgi:hypothetical protein